MPSTRRTLACPALVLALVLQAEPSLAYGAVGRPARPPGRMRSAQLPRCAVGDAGESAPAPPPAAEAAGADGEDAGIPESMVAIAEALQQDSIAPQWTDGAVEPAGESGGASARRPVAPRLPPLREDELDELARLGEPSYSLSAAEEELLASSLESIDYLGDWSCPSTRDSIVLACEEPRVIPSPSGGAAEFTCDLDGFTRERRAVHSRIVRQMLRGAHVAGGGRWGGKGGGRWGGGRGGGGAAARGAAAGGGAGGGGAGGGGAGGGGAGGGGGGGGGGGARSGLARGPGRGPLSSVVPGDGAQHVFLVVGVPGSGKDSVLKRYLRSLDGTLLDASAPAPRAATARARLQRTRPVTAACGGWIGGLGKGVPRRVGRGRALDRRPGEQREARARRRSACRRGASGVKC